MEIVVIVIIITIIIIVIRQICTIPCFLLMVLHPIFRLWGFGTILFYGVGVLT